MSDLVLSNRWIHKAINFWVPSFLRNLIDQQWIKTNLVLIDKQKVSVVVRQCEKANNQLLREFIKAHKAVDTKNRCHPANHKNRSAKWKLDKPPTKNNLRQWGTACERKWPIGLEKDNWSWKASARPIKFWCKRKWNFGWTCKVLSRQTACLLVFFMHKLRDRLPKVWQCDSQTDGGSVGFCDWLRLRILLSTWGLYKCDNVWTPVHC